MLLPSNPEKSRLDIKGLRLFMGGELTGYWGLLMWLKLYIGNAGHFLIGLFLYEVIPGELLRYLFSPLAAGNLRATHVFHAEHTHGL